MKQWIECRKIVPLEVTALWNTASMLGRGFKVPLTKVLKMRVPWSLPKVDSGVRWLALVKKWIALPVLGIFRVDTWLVLLCVEASRFGTPELPGMLWWFQASTNLLKAKASVDRGPWYTELCNIVAHVNVIRTFDYNQSLLDRIIHWLISTHILSPRWFDIKLVVWVHDGVVAN